MDVTNEYGGDVAVAVVVVNGVDGAVVVVVIDGVNVAVVVLMIVVVVSCLYTGFSRFCFDYCRLCFKLFSRCFPPCL